MEQVHFHLMTPWEVEIDFSGKWPTFLMVGLHPPQPLLSGSQTPSVSKKKKKKVTDMQILFPPDSSSAVIWASIMEVL